jgi:hypothetical protein
MKCGEEIQVKDIRGSYSIRFIAQCNGRYMVIAHPQYSYMNGYLLMDWKAVLRELIAVTVPAKLSDKMMAVESSAGNMYHCIPLTYPLSIRGLAEVLGEDIEQVKAQVADTIPSYEN